MKVNKKQHEYLNNFNISKMNTIATSNVNEISRDEIAGLTAILATKKRPIPTKIDYDNICFDEFITDMKYNPRPVFNNAFKYANDKIEAALESFDSVKHVGINAWQITTGFITVDVCLHANTEYIQSELEHEDLAVHRSVVSIVARFDIHNVYRYTKYSVETFRSVNDFYTKLRSALME